MKTRRKWMKAASVSVLLVVCLVYVIVSKQRNEPEAKDGVQEEADLTSRPVETVPRKVNHVLASKERGSTDSEQGNTEIKRVRISEIGTNAEHRVWVDAKYGPSENELGYKPSGGEEQMPPQGFTVTRDGKLLVLDTFKQRLVYYDKNGRVDKVVRLENTGFVRPSDVDVAADGTIAVLDADAGQAPKGLVLLDAEGNVKAQLPNIKPDVETKGVYSNGNDIFFDNQIWGSRKVAETNGTASSETPNLYKQEENGLVPGRIAPDGVTVVAAGTNDRDKAEFFVTVIRGEKPEHVFTRFYLVPPQLLEIPFAAADGAGNLYVVLFYDMRLFLACMDNNGDPVGQVELPRNSGNDPGRPFRQFRVMETGGLLYQVLTDTGSSYEWFDCHP